MGAENVLLIGKLIIFVIWGLGIACEPRGIHEGWHTTHTSLCRIAT